MATPLRVAVSIESIAAAPGDTFTFDVTVRNTSDIVEHYVVEILGLPTGATTRIEPDIAKLRPGESATATVRLAVPENAAAAAGLYTLGVLVRSRYRGEVSRCEELPLTLAAVDDVTVRVDPEVATGGRGARYTVQVSNGGNLPVRLALAASDPERRVTSTFDPPLLDLPQGASAYAFLEVRAPVPWNKEKQRVLTVEATGGGTRGTGTATFVQQPRFASKLVRAAGMVGAVLALAGAVLAAALIARPDDDPQQRNQVAGEPSPSVAAPPTAAPPTSAAPPPTSAPPTTAAAPATTGAAAPQPRRIDVTRPFGEPANGVIPNDAFREQGFLLSGAPDPGGPAECADATLVAVSGDGNSGRSLSAADPDGTAACTGTAVQIRPVISALAMEVIVAGDARTRQLVVVYRDLSQSVENDLKVTAEERRGEIDFLIVRGLPAAAGEQPPPVEIRAVRITP
ncbi:NEW3 domain-containing protein [Actinomycetes bacterium KLBMP 9797]